MHTETEHLISKHSAVWSFKTDVENRSFGDWFEAHTSFCLPLHHYEGSIQFDGRHLVLEGHHKSDATKTVRLVLGPTEVRDVFYGFDDTFRRREDRGLGLGFRPLRITYTVKGSDAPSPSIIYVAVDFSRALRTTRNSEWSELLNKWIKRA
eukprot:TRINITY_DN8980_c0_g1_i1.p1 TRINITY_DN8980_c0_g1~~TRINITY_DN8980_c0_g1_i1.p1  ORF type:complete len:151 (-),score=7.24 TRINITY_DN8980_c0_g1_i1:126-578(-)